MGPENIIPQTDNGRKAIEHNLRRPIIVDHFPEKSAGAIFPQDDIAEQGYSNVFGKSNDNPYAPFNSQIDWEVAKWAKLRGPGSNACSELLNIPGLQEALGLSYKNTQDLNHIIDNQITNTRPQFRRGEITAGGITYDVYFRDIIECVKALFGDPEFAPILVFAPEKQDRKSTRLNSSHSGESRMPSSA